MGQTAHFSANRTSWLHSVPNRPVMQTTLTRRHWMILIACATVGALVGLLAAARTTDTYRSSTTLYIDAPNAIGVSEELKGVQLSGQLRESFAEIATSASSMADVIERLGLDASPDALANRIETRTSSTTLLIEISAVASDPEAARQLSATTAAVLIERVEGLSAGGGSVSASVVDPARAGEAVPAQRSVSTAIGGIIGLLVGLGAASVLDRADDRVRGRDDIELVLGATPLATIPRSRGLDVVRMDGSDSAKESFRMLASAVASQAKRQDPPITSIGVTSAASGDGKTTVAMNLALALSMGGRRVVLVDADLRRSTLSQRCGFDANPGLGDVFLGRSSIDDALVDCNPTLRFLPAGTTPPNAASVAESDRVAEIFRALAVDAEFVIVDTPPAVAVSEGAVLAATLDGTVVVVRENQTARASLEELQRRIEAVGGDVFATVLNAGRNARTEYEYGRSGYSKQGGRR